MTDKMVFRGRLSGAQRMRLGKLMNMLYKPKELSREIGFTVRQVYRVYIPLGCPYIKDAKKHIWIKGDAFAEWYEATYPKQTLSADEAFCLSCRRPVKIIKTSIRKKGRLTYLVGSCSDCGSKLCRITNRERRDDKSQ